MEPKEKEESEDSSVLENEDEIKINRDNLLKKYSGYNPNFIICLRELAEFYLRKNSFRHDVEELYNDSKKKYGRFDGLREIVTNSVIIRNMMSKVNMYPLFFALIDKKTFRNFIVYSIGCRGGRHIRPIIHLDSIVYKRGHKKLKDEENTSSHKVVVLEGHAENECKQPLVIKYYKNLDHDSHNILYEIKMYDKIRKTGLKMPFYSTSYRICDDPVLVMEKLDEIDATEDDEFEIGTQVLDQLRYMHKIGTHNDIKPSNIMKRLMSDGSFEYFLIDYGGFTDEPLHHGYRRKVWTKHYTSQVHHDPREDNKGRRVHIKQITTPIHDFIELGFAIRGIQVQRDGKSVDGKNNRSGFEGKLEEYIDKVNELANKYKLKKKIKKSEYDKLIAILKK